MVREMTIYFDENRVKPIRVEIKLSAILAFSAFKTHFNQLIDNKEISYPGLYFLWGRTGPDGEYTGKSHVYIGKTIDLMRRTREHALQDWWDHIILFTSTNGCISEADVGYLERSIYDDLNKANKVITQPHTPPGSPLPKMDEKVLFPLKEDIYQILSVLGHPDISMKQSDEFYLDVKGIKARMEYSPGIFTVQKNSMIQRFDPVMAKQPGLNWVANRQDYYFDKGLIRPDGTGKNILQEQLTFSTASAASQFVLGHTDDGKITWLNSRDGRNWSQFVGDSDL